MKHYTLYNIYKATRSLLLATGLLLAGGVAWGQGMITELTPDNEVIEDLYVSPGVPKIIQFQVQGGMEGTNTNVNDNTDNIDGYIRWYTVIGGRKGIWGLTPPDKSNNTVQGNNPKLLTPYSNGYAWYRTDFTKTASSDAACWITCQFTQQQLQQGVTLYCEGSSTAAYRDGDNLVPRRVSVRRTYRVKSASERYIQLNGKKTSFDALRMELAGGNGSIKTLLDKADKTSYLMYEYNIHIPIGKQTTFRLPEKLDNYYPNRNYDVAKHVRWLIYNEEGTYMETKTSTNNMLTDYDFNTSGTDRQYFYILAQVSSDNQSWYPVSLLNLIFEPYSEHLTNEGLADVTNDPDYEERIESKLLAEGKYELIDSVCFEEPGDVLTAESEKALEGFLSGNAANKIQNIRETTFELQSYYAFASPREYEFKKQYRASVGRNEYALYRTLNYGDISGKGTFINGDRGLYTDYFADYYKVKAVDRLWEKNNGEKSGYFMYVDAADDPGIITKIPIDKLCANTSLIVTAWVCNLNPWHDYVDADLGFTFKRKNADDTETILAKYYTGKFDRKPTENEANADANNLRAKWQQIYFKFSFNEDLINENIDGIEYFIEVSNNCEKSAGADYGIDEIKIFRSLPDIDVQRNDACDASTLKVSSDYGTMQRNMGWDLDNNALKDFIPNDIHYRKYRYGLMGPDPHAEKTYANLGNVYFAFTEVINQGSDKVAGDWVVVNKDLEGNDVAVAHGLHQTIRVAVQTDMTPTTESADLLAPIGQENALAREITMNIRAMNDYNADHWRGPDGTTGDPYWPTNEKSPIIDLSQLWNGTPEANGASTKGDAKDGHDILKDPVLLEVYEQNLKILYEALEIPRLRCPWIEDNNRDILYLSVIDVANTDLRFAQELISGPGEKPVYASGEYYVVVFSAADVINKTTVNVDAECTLKSLFYVVPSIRIRVDTETEASGVTCVGSIHTLKADLMVADVDQHGNVVSTDMKPFEKEYGDSGYNYTFDWYLGSLEDSQKEVEGTTYASLQELLADFRKNSNNEGIKNGGDFGPEDISKASISSEAKDVLVRLLGDETTEPKLVSGKSPSFRWVEKVVAMPYVSGPGELTANTKLFCTESQELTLSAESDVPELSVGFPDVSYPADIPLNNVPLRLGLVNLKDKKTTLNIPIQNNVQFGIVGGTGHVLREIASKNHVLIRKNVNTYEKVATLNSLYADDTQRGGNSLSLTFDILDETKVEGYFKEGETYSLYIPFGEYENANASAPIPNSCEGYAILNIKIVPEYLTWKGDTDVWYNDGNWNQSTEAELYMDNEDDDDANGSDPVENAFSPLYFTKVTIAPESNGENGELQLKSVKADDAANGTLTDLATEEHQYIGFDMAVNNTGTDGALKVTPYYINNVSEIYFKPNATLMNQHLLTYDTARVEFIMMQDSSYWMASPLKAVYAGDMYTLLDGIQNTPAFDYITYDDNVNSRWNPAFYQKAWDKAVAYAVSNSDDGTAVKDTGRVAAVKSNWSIEYNDVWVPYTLGKGFYARVEGKDVTVRLPKADSDYKYESAPTTRATDPELSDKGDRTDAGKMADGEVMQITLEASVDGDGTHYLVGNPYMTYLNMNQFFNGTNNQSLQKKYWKLDRERGIEAIVGTPDVGWTGTETEDGTGGKAISGFIAPMEAFFVEVDPAVAPDKPAVVNFNIGMMATKEQATKQSPATRSVFATSPVLTLTADRDGKKGRSVITLRDKAINAYQPQEDVVVLLDSELDAPVAYSVAGNRAAQVNALRSIDNVPVGVYSSREGDVTVTIEGMDQLAEPLYLYDAHTRKSTLLEGDSYTLELSGESHGRYYLRSSAIGSVGDNAIAVYSVQSGKVIVSSTQEVRNIKVYSLSGAMVKNYMNLNTTQYTFNLSAGVYVVHAEGRDDTVKVEKVMVR